VVNPRGSKRRFNPAFLRPSPRCTTKIEILTGCRHGNCLPCLASGEVSHWCPRRSLHSSRRLSQVVRWVAWHHRGLLRLLCLKFVLSEKRYCWYLWGTFLDDLAAISQHLFPRVFTQQNGWILVLKKIPKWITFIMITNNCASSRNQHYYLGGGNSNIFYFNPYLGKIPNLTTVFFFGSVETTNQIHP